MQILLKIVTALLFYIMSTGAYAATVEKINVGIGYLEVSTALNKAVFNLTLQEQNGATPPAYPYVVYSDECPSDQIELNLSDDFINIRLFSVLLAAKQGQNYVDVRYELGGDPEVCTLKAITIKYKQN